MIEKEDILKALAAVKYPPYNKDIVSFGMVKYVKIEGDSVSVKIFTGAKNKDSEIAVLQASQEVLSQKFPSYKFSVNALDADPAKENSPQKDFKAFEKIRLKIAVASGKGGVGKSTVAINLAKAFARLYSKNSPRVALMDCDVHGPSAPMLLKDASFPEVNNEQKIIPPVVDGIKVISMGNLVAADQPLIWRGAMIMGAIKQFINEVVWGELDVMVFDLPPGTGDAVLTVAQTVPLDGAIIVTTPNQLAATTATRGAKLFEKTDIKIFGVVENMAYLELPNAPRQYIFGKGCAEESAKTLGVELLACVPIDASLQAESEIPASDESQKIFDDLAEKIGLIANV